MATARPKLNRLEPLPGIEKKDGPMSSSRRLGGMTGPSGTGSTGGGAQPYRQILCVDSLVNGCVNSFIDLFALSHRPAVLVDPVSETMFSIPDSKLSFVKTHLESAEKSQAAGEYQKAYECYRTIGQYFENERDLNMSLALYQKGLDHANMSSDRELEAVANQNLGLAYERLGQTNSAIKFHETHLQLAEASQNESSQKEAHEHLFGAYSKVAEEASNEERPGSALSLYMKALATADAARDHAKQAEAYKNLTRVSQEMGDTKSAIEHALKYLQLSRRSGDKLEEIEALSTLSTLHETVGDLASAARYLEDSIEIAGKKEDQQAESKMYSKLGSLFTKQKLHEKAVQCFENAFRIAQELGDRAQINSTKVQLGFARGNLASTSFLKDVVSGDLETLIAWKDRRAPFVGPDGTVRSRPPTAS